MTRRYCRLILQGTIQVIFVLDFGNQEPSQGLVGRVLLIRDALILNLKDPVQIVDRVFFTRCIGVEIEALPDTEPNALPAFYLGLRTDDEGPVVRLFVAWRGEANAVQNDPEAVFFWGSFLRG